MRLPRDIDGPRLVKALNLLGYEATTQRDGENHEVVPWHHPIKTGTLSSILKRIATHHGMSVDELLKLLDL